jgi:hypothetical protein
LGSCTADGKDRIYGVGACRVTEVPPVVTTTVLNVVTDLIIMVLPIILFWNVVWRNRWAVLFLLSLALLTIGATLARVNLAYSNKLSNSGSREKPVLEFTRKAEMWVTVEIFVAMFASGLPVLRSGFVLWREKQTASQLVTTEMYWTRKAASEGERELMYGGNRRRRPRGRASLDSLEGVMGVLPSLHDSELEMGGEWRESTGVAGNKPTPAV